MRPKYTINAYTINTNTRDKNYLQTFKNIQIKSAAIIHT